MPYVDTQRLYFAQPRIRFMDPPVIRRSFPRSPALADNKWFGPQGKRVRRVKRSQYHETPNHNLNRTWDWSVDGVIRPRADKDAWPGMERTWSYRTGKTLSQRSDALTGPEIAALIRSGSDLAIDLDAPGGIIDTGENFRFGEDINRWDIGHEFRTLKEWRTYSTFVNVQRLSGGHVIKYEGPLWVFQPGERLTPDVPFTTSSSDIARLHAMGNRAISLSAPTRPEAQMAQFTEQLYMLPSMPILMSLKARGTGRNPGSEFLNVVFGWKPMLSDIQKLAAAVLDQRKLVEQMRLQVSRMYHRRVQLVEQEVTSTSTPCGLQIEANVCRDPYMGWSTLGPNASSGVRLDRKVESIYFVGLFSFYMQETETLLGRLTAYERMADQLLGGSLTLDQLWEVTPWSWLIDWFTDTQEFLARVTRLSEDGLVLRYGYVMRSIFAERTFMSPSITAYNGTVIPTPQLSFSAWKAERVRSTPYGFGVDLSGMSPARWAILGALGMTLAPGLLRFL